MKKKAKILTFFDNKNKKFSKILLFLNKYCLNKKNIEKLNDLNVKFDFQKNIYDNDKKNLKEFIYCNNLYEKILKELSRNLNKLHDESWTKKSWEILIGAWLNRYIAVINDRLNHIIQAKKKYNISLRSFNEEKKKNIFISADMKNFTLNCLSKEWNQKLLNRLINLYEKKNFQLRYLSNTEVNITKPITHNRGSRLIFFIKNKINFLLNLFYKLNINYCVLNRTYVGNTFESFKLCLKLKEIPLKFFYQTIKFDKNYNKTEREKLCVFRDSKDLKEKIIRYLLPEMIPLFYVENFKTLKANLILQNLPTKKMLIYTRNLWKDDIFKFWVANQINNRSKLIYGQHGAGYGLFKGFFGDYFETRISNIFLTWGHSYNITKNSSRIIRCSSPFASKFKNYLITKKKVKQNSIISIVPGVGNIFLSRNELFNYPTYENDNLFNFVNYLSKTLRREIVVKPHPLDKIKSFSHSKSLYQLNKKIKILEPHDNLKKLTLNSKILIFTSISTEFFKNLSNNVPSIFIIQEFYKKTFNKTAFKYFEKLKKSNIVFYKGKDAAKFLNKNYSSLEEWWFSSKTQKNIKLFNKEFINTSENSSKKILDTLKNTKNEILNLHEKY